MKVMIGILFLWLVALVATVLLLKDNSILTYLLPVYAICMIGSVIILRSGSKR